MYYENIKKYYLQQFNWETQNVYTSMPVDISKAQTCLSPRQPKI